MAFKAVDSAADLHYLQRWLAKSITANWKHGTNINKVMTSTLLRSLTTSTYVEDDSKISLYNNNIQNMLYARHLLGRSL